MMGTLRQVVYHLYAELFHISLCFRMDVTDDVLFHLILIIFKVVTHFSTIVIRYFIIPVKIFIIIFIVIIVLFFIFFYYNLAYRNLLYYWLLSFLNNRRFIFTFPRFFYDLLENNIAISVYVLIVDFFSKNLGIHMLVHLFFQLLRIQDVAPSIKI